MPHANRGGEGGDRQRREKGPPILTAEKGEFHESSVRSAPYFDILIDGITAVVE